MHDATSAGGRELSGAVCIVTGGAQGIGLAVAELLASRGAAVAIFDIQGDAAIAAATTLGARHRVECLGLAVDVSDGDALESAVTVVETRLGTVTGLAHCAAITTAPASAEAVDHDAFDRIIAVNLKGTFLTCQAVGRRMLQHGRGSIVTISSTLGVSVQKGRLAYATAKWGVMGLSQSMAVDWAERGVRVNVVIPQATETAMLRQNLSPMVERLIIPRTPMGRLGEPEDVAEAVAFLLSDRSCYVTGTSLRVDGGISTGFYYE